MVKLEIKPRFEINLAKDNPSHLRASLLLAKIKDGASYHQQHDCRHPLGIYNISTSRILRKVIACASRLERLHLNVDCISKLIEQRDLQEEIIDYLELSLYAAAEHVDDLDTIIHCFYSTNREYKNASHVSEFLKSFKPIRDRISAFTNAIKHNQSRVRLFSVDFLQNGNAVCLHGFFIEQFHGGAVAPSKIFHSGKEKIISVTSFLWEIIYYLITTSEALCNFLTAIDVVDQTAEVASSGSQLSNCLVHLVRLPLYSFDEVHTFEKATFSIGVDETFYPRVKSGLYGSMTNRWARTQEGQLGGFVLGYDGDGVTRTFSFLCPTSLRLQHWD